jgi:hypothetical protein
MPSLSAQVSSVQLTLRHNILRIIAVYVDLSVLAGLLPCIRWCCLMTWREQLSCPSGAQAGCCKVKGTMQRHSVTDGRWCGGGGICSWLVWQHSSACLQKPAAAHKQSASCSSSLNKRGAKHKTSQAAGRIPCLRQGKER